MSRWFRFDDDVINDPKILKLSDKLYRFWTGVLCIASKSGGALPSIEDIAVLLRTKPSAATEAMESLVAAGLIDCDDGISAPHNWKKRQYKSDVSTARVQQHRNAKRNVSETPPERPVEQADSVSVSSPLLPVDSSSLVQQSSEPRARGLEADFEDWYSGYPLKVGRKDAFRAFVKARKEVDQQALIDGRERYKRDKPPDISWSHPATWLNKGRWSDEPADKQLFGGNGAKIGNGDRPRGGFSYSGLSARLRAGQGGDPVRREQPASDRQQADGFGNPERGLVLVDSK